MTLKELFWTTISCIAIMYLVSGDIKLTLIGTAMLWWPLILRTLFFRD